ncbi:hypothetical protein SUGI_0904160 [Cryptomeria japonica]|nr:hypothetical protein SUGI_0904160 [Cryptomeria japonica]
MPSTISTIENAFALVPTPVSMGSNEVYPSSDNKTLSLNQARRTSVRTSKYRGVARHKWTGRYEAYLWDNSFIKEGHKRKGRQGGYGTELEAARAYDNAALKKSTGFTRSESIYRGVTRHHQKGKCQARIGKINGNKDVYLGTYSTEEEAAIIYNIATIKFRGNDSVTNFDNRFSRTKSSPLPIGQLITYIKETGLRDVDRIMNAPRIVGNRMGSPRGAASYCNDVAESKTAHDQQQSNPLLSTSQSHSGLWYKPADDMQAVTNISHSFLGQPILTSSNQVLPQIDMGLGPAIINEANISDVFAANGLGLSNSSVVFANPSDLFALNNFQTIPMGTVSNGLGTANFEGSDLLARNATYLNTQKFTVPGRLENQNLMHSSWIVEPLESLPPQANPSNGHACISPRPWNSKKNSVQME